MTARAYLRSRSWLGTKFGLQTMKGLVRELGHPEKAFRSVLIAGTNGKGSVSAYLDTALRAAGLKVGRYTSPHLIDIRERITVSGQNIGNAEFERLVLEVRDAAEALKRRGVIKNHPNHFEILTAVAFLHFRKQKVDVAVLEVGLGGRLDATNVADPLVSAIVSIDFDHEEFLGHTLPAIAAEKAGVIRKKRTVVLGPMDAGAQVAILKRAKTLSAPVVRAFGGVTVRSTPTGFTVRTPSHLFKSVKPLPGAHQRANVLVAIRTLEALAEAGVAFDLTNAVAAINDAVWPGRLESFVGRPKLLLDGAHNPAGAKALAAYLKETKAKYILVFGAMRDKHVREMAAEIFPAARLVIATRVRMTRAATTFFLADIAKHLGKTVVEEPSITRALSKAKRLARPGETVVVAGSLYLVGAVRKRLVDTNG
ncbi:MAG: folylpolyglutamate synthase/dihydrofolate synthase family protein [Vicinamibacteria bacterium]